MVYMYAKESRFERKVFVFLMKFNVKAIQLHLPSKLTCFKRRKKIFFYFSNWYYNPLGYKVHLVFFLKMAS